MNHKFTPLVIAGLTRQDEFRKPEDD